MQHALKLAAHQWTYDDAERLGDPGGFGSVYKGRGPDSRVVAIKILDDGSNGVDNRELDFARSVVGRIGEHIITILDHGLTPDGRPCIVMEIADRTLRDYIASSSSDVRHQDAIEIVRQICKGLIEARDWIHRDLKPANILQVEGRWKIADFGIAKVDGAGTASGTLKAAKTPAYAAPEQWAGGTATHATDVYALGCIAFELLEGVVPFRGQNLAYQHLNEAPVIAEGAPALRLLVLAMLSKHQLARPQFTRILDQLGALEFAARPSALSGRLAGIAASISREKAAAEAAEAESRAKEEVRSQMAASAREAFKQIAGELLRQISESIGAPVPQLINERGVASHRELTLGKAKLRVSENAYAYIVPDDFRLSGWDVLCGEVIGVKGPKYGRAASLWFASIRGGPYEWIEVGYGGTINRGAPANNPAALPPGRDADFAAGAGMHTWSLAYKPIAISGEGVNAFIERWSTHLADAAEGRSWST